jgi:hypothetical protein
VTAYPEKRAVARKAGRDRIVVGGVDVSNFRGKTTPFPAYSLTEPFAYGATSLTFPQVHAGYERTGVGDLSWAKKGARVQLSRVWDDGTEVIDYVGEVASIDPTGRVLRMDVGGQFAGPASMLQEVTQMYRSERDVGRWASLACARVGLAFDPWFGPDTTIDLTHTGGQTLLSWAQYVCAMSQDNGLQRTIMPMTWGSDTWHFPVKDYTTVHATAFHDDARVVLSVTDDVSEQPNVIYGTGITPDGVRITNAKWPNVFSGPMPDYPIAGGTSFGLGTTDADTVNLDGITVLYDKLRNMGYLPWQVANTGIYTADFVAAVKKLQRKAGLSQTGTMTLAAWKALYNADVTGYTINGAYREPLAEDDRVRGWNRASNGAILGRNPLYDPTVPRVEVDLDYGSGITKAAMVRHAQGILARSNAAKNWTGTLRFNNAGLFLGDQSAADRGALTADDMMPMRDLRPGMNVIVPDFDGGTLFHVAGCDVDADGVTATIDTQARDLVEVRAINDRDAESRRDIRREWNQANRPAKKSHGLISSDENFGELDRNVRLVGNKWNVIPVIVGQHGQINRIDLRTINNKAEFAVAILTKPMTTGGKGGVSSRLKRRFGNPLAVSDQSWLEDNDVQDMLDDRVILYAAGDGKQPCGYYPRRKLNDAGNTTGAPITGRHLDDENFAYICAAHTQVIVYLAIYPDRDCTLKRGQILWAQLDDAV